MSDMADARNSSALLPLSFWRLPRWAWPSMRSPMLCVSNQRTSSLESNHARNNY